MAERVRDQSRPDSKVTQSFAAKIRRHKTALDEVRGKLGQVYEQLENAGLHKGAFKAALKLKNMDPTSADEWLRHFRYYCEDLGIEAQGDLFEEGARQAEEIAARDGEAADYSDTLAYRQGANAGEQGRPATDNPYEENSAGYAAFNAGWLQSQEKIASDMNGDGKPKRERKRKAEEQPAQTDA